MGKRIFFGALYGAGLIGVFGFAPLFSPYLLGLFTLLLINEVSTILKVESRFPLLSFAGILLVLGAVTDRGNWLQDVLASAVGMSILLSFALLRAEAPVREMRRGLFTIAYVWTPMALMVHAAAYHSELILFIFAMIWSSDSLAYFSGRLFGKTPFAPKLSPKKTVEGFIGGALGTMGTAYVLNYYWDLLDMPLALALGFAVAITAPFGDLVASALKREAGIKDSGVFLPGHGGALDRLDSFLTAAPIAVLIYLYWI